MEGPLPLKLSGTFSDLKSLDNLRVQLAFCMNAGILIYTFPHQVIFFSKDMNVQCRYLSEVCGVFGSKAF